jgi:hypothetical protein
MTTHLFSLLWFLFLYGLSNVSLSQVTIWEEDFEGYTNGTQTDPGRWAYTCSNCDSPKGVSNGSISFSGGGIGSEANGNWRTLSLDLSNYEDISISLDVSEDGNLESSDFAIVEYQIESGPWIIAQNLTGDFNSRNVTISDISGSSLILRVRARVNRSSEEISVDNVLIT